MRYPSSPANGEEREALCSGSADDDEEDEDDDRLQGNGTLTVSDRDSIAVHHLLSGPPNTESSTLPALLSDHFISPEDPFLQACPWR